VPLADLVVTPVPSIVTGDEVVLIAVSWSSPGPPYRIRTVFEVNFFHVKTSAVE
jgi:hypothetical protein